LASNVPSEVRGEIPVEVDVEVEVEAKRPVDEIAKTVNATMRRRFMVTVVTPARNGASG
jgi:hypothetical protein